MRDPLFDPIRINQLEVQNRICLPAMHLDMADNFHVTEKMKAFYRERARGGAGLICVGYATVDDRSGSPLNIGAHRDEFVPGLQELAQEIRQGGAVSAVQLNHAGRYNPSFFMEGREPVAPSAIASRFTKETPHALEKDEIREIVASFAAAAGRVRKAGFDAVEILCGTGYLISEFLSPLTNQREDEYGGSPENRLRFPLEVLRAVREAIGSDFPLVVRMNGNDLMPGGMDREELRETARHLAGEAMADALHVNVGWHEAAVPQIVPSVPRGGFAYLARGIKEAVDVPVVASHRINDPDTARELISSHMCDMAAIGRGLIADPELPEKARQGRERDILHCIGCGQGCMDNLFRMAHVECLVNPRAGHELELPQETVERPQRVLVAGGGPAGMSAAMAASDAGHEVILVEKSDRLGGQLHIAGSPPGREEFAVLARDLARQTELRGVCIETGKAATPELIREYAPDRVILCTGGAPITPDIPGADGDNVCQAWDVLAGRAHPGMRVIVVGGGAAGVETALFLGRKGTLDGETLKFLLSHNVEDCDTLRGLCLSGTKEITVVEMLDKLGRDIGPSTRWTMKQEMAALGITSKARTTALEITPEGLKAETENGPEFLPADSVVLAVGTTSHNPLQTEVEHMNIPCSTVGDASEPGQAIQAIRQGYLAGRNA
jgi:2,4-dienoyl-CoA reductase (NADPH2)